MPYQQVQYIAYVINTAPQRNNGIKTYLGLPDAAEDIDARCQLILRAIQTAQANIAQSSPPEAPGTTLKIFLAPEFYFRGSTGAYDMDSVQLAISALQNMVKGDEWNDWLFGFGSILGLSAPTFPYPPYNINPAAKKEVYNFTLLQRGGSANQGPQGANVVTKELKSGIDFITQTQSANNTDILIGNVNYLPPASSSGPGRERQQLNYDGAGICTISDITFGVEICLDHSAETAPGVYVGRLQQSPQLPNEPQIQIQLIPSCGMTIHNAQVMTEINGYVFHCDGGGNSSGAKERLLVGAPPQDTLQNIPVLNTVVVNNAAITLNQSPPKIVTIDQLYAGGPGSLNFYTTKPVPPATLVPGHTVILNWNATPSAPDFRFKFTLVYDGNRNFQTLLCNISANEDLFQSLDYLIPLTIDTTDSQDRDINIYMTLRTGASPYDYALWCNIQTPEFNFSGIAFQFFKNDAGGTPDTCW